MYSDIDRRNYQNRLYKKRRKWALDFIGGKCSKCGTFNNLTIDHINPKDKSYNISSALRWKPIKELKKELMKCQVLCKECHYKKTLQDCPLNMGEKNGSAVLSDTDILNIRADNRSSRKIAADYGISHVAILNIKNRKNWSHVK